MPISAPLYTEDLTSHPNHLKLHCYFPADHSNHCFAILYFFIFPAFSLPFLFIVIHRCCWHTFGDEII